MPNALLASTLPPSLWWLGGFALAVLGIAAAIDARTGRVPDTLIFLGLAGVTAAQGVFIDWHFASMHLAVAIAIAMVLWGLNSLWYGARKHDAIGMGDAKWTMLAVDAFGIGPAILAWGIGAILGILWMGGARALNKPAGRVYFAPFLFAGLLIGFYWLRAR